MKAEVAIFLMIATIRISILVVAIEIVQSFQMRAYNLEMFGLFSQKKLLKAKNILMVTKPVLNSGCCMVEKSFFC